MSLLDYLNGFGADPASEPTPVALGNEFTSTTEAGNPEGNSKSPAVASGPAADNIPVTNNGEVQTGKETDNTTANQFDSSIITTTPNYSDNTSDNKPELSPMVPQLSFLPTIDREGITKFINEQCYLCLLYTSKTSQ